MRTRKMLFFVLCLVASLLPLGAVAAQDVVPLVTIRVTDPIAAETKPTQIRNPGEFTVYRSNIAPAMDLYVYYKIGGTATNGRDYRTLSGLVVIPANARSAVIPVVPIDDNLPELAESVVVQLTHVCTLTFCATNPSDPVKVVIYDND